ncbi:MAG: hypothetical protein K1X94_36760, partial [Sandaracinaceae bacterium]|nr:hypothetical protein [Sandaracinaceae bacterium]
MRWWLLPAILLVSCGGADEVSSGDDAGGDEVGADVASDASGLDAAVEDAPIDDMATTDSAGSESGAACGCASFLAPVTAGTMPAVLTETSGLAASRKNPGVLYAHNDSGDTARIFALDEKGALLGQIDFGGASATDWEDLAVGPCGGTTCVFVGDV